MKTLDELEEEREATQLQVDIAERRALLAEAKRRYGSDWKDKIPKFQSGIDWGALKFQLR